MSEMPQAYEQYLGELIKRWENIYLPEVVRVLKNEFAAFVDGLEGILSYEDTIPSHSHPNTQKSNINMEYLDFYKDPKYSHLRPDETKLKDLSATEKAMTMFIGNSTHEVKNMMIGIRK